MSKTNLALRPIHYACVSGGKDSLLMLKLILSMPQKYPLDMVVNYDLEIEFDWEKKVVNYIEEECNRLGIKFVRIKPRQSWDELYAKYDFPNRAVRWCNNKYKLDCNSQLNAWIKEQNCRPVAYIGLCADEQKRFKYDIGNWKDQDLCYPIAEEGINEDVILEWAKTQPIFDGWYTHFRRGGCMFCPNATMKQFAYMYWKMPEVAKKYETMILRYEDKFKRPWLKEPWQIVKRRLYKKWIPILEDEEKFTQVTVMDILKGENNES